MPKNSHVQYCCSTELTLTQNLMANIWGWNFCILWDNFENCIRLWYFEKSWHFFTLQHSEIFDQIASTEYSTKYCMVITNFLEHSGVDFWPMETLFAMIFTKHWNKMRTPCCLILTKQDSSKFWSWRIYQESSSKFWSWKVYQESPSKFWSWKHLQ